MFEPFFPYFPGEAKIHFRAFFFPISGAGPKSISSQVGRITKPELTMGNKGAEEAMDNCLRADAVEKLPHIENDEKSSEECKP